MPVVNDEYGYIGEHDDASEQQPTKVPLTREKHRNILWGIYVAGGYASAGDKFAYTGPPGMPYFSADWHDTPAYGDMKRLVDFFTIREVTYWTMASKQCPGYAGRTDPCAGRQRATVRILCRTERAVCG